MCLQGHHRFRTMTNETPYEMTEWRELMITFSMEFHFNTSLMFRMTRSYRRNDKRLEHRWLRSFDDVMPWTYLLCRPWNSWNRIDMDKQQPEFITDGKSVLIPFISKNFSVQMHRCIWQMNDWPVAIFDIVEKNGQHKL